MTVKAIQMLVVQIHTICSNVLSQMKTYTKNGNHLEQLTKCNTVLYLMKERKETNSVMSNWKVHKSKITSRWTCRINYIMIKRISHISIMTSIDVTVSIVNSTIDVSTTNTIEVEVDRYLMMIKEWKNTSHLTVTTVTMIVQSTTLMPVNVIDRTVTIISIVDMIIDEVVREIVIDLNVMTFTESKMMSVDDDKINIFKKNISNLRLK